MRQLRELGYMNKSTWIPHRLSQTMNAKGSYLQNFCLFFRAAVHLTTSLDTTEPIEM